MKDDIYFDCPECSHTMVVSPDQVGGQVECPDCGHDIRVPDIREGMNPRYRSERPAHSLNESSKPAFADCLVQLSSLSDGLKRLSQKTEGRIEEMGHLEKSVNLVHQQLGLLDSVSAGSPGNRTAEDEGSGEPSGEIWGPVAVGLSVLTLVAVIVVAVILLNP